MKTIPSPLLCLALLCGSGLAADESFDPVSWKLGGLRGSLVGPSNDEHPFQSEGTTVKLKDGTLLHAFNLRYGEKDMSQWHPHYARTVIAKVLSRDRGETWTKPAPSPLLSPESPANIARLPGSDELVLIWNSQSVSERNTHVGQRLTLASTVSSDGGRTWRDYREIITIPPNPGNPQQGFGDDRVCYPSLLFDSDLAYIGYWAGARVDGRQYNQQYMMVLPVSFFTALRETHRPAAFGATR